MTSTHDLRDLRTTHPGHAALTAASQIPGLPPLTVFAGRIEITAPLSPEMADILAGVCHYEQLRTIWVCDLDRWQDLVAALPAVAQANIARGDQATPSRICLHVLGDAPLPEIGHILRWRSPLRGREYRVAEHGQSMRLPVLLRDAGLGEPTTMDVKWFFADALA